MSVVNFNMVSSGSKGNSTLIWDEENLIMIDFGITLKRLRERMMMNRISGLEASLFISHEHSDHSKGARMLARNMDVSIYTREATAGAIGLRDAYSIRDSVVLGNFEVKAFSVSHDAVDPVAYTVRCGKARISVVSDLGFMSDEVAQYISGSDILAIEANHDERMLMTGSYPDMLKRRIFSNHGHLSNRQTAEKISRLVKPDTKIVLTHLSQENNRPEIALNEIGNALKDAETPYGHLECASQETGSSFFSLDID